MTNSKIYTVLLATAAFGLSACGGGGGGGIASIPAPPPTPTPTPTPTPAGTDGIIPAATTSQQFAVAGASHLQGDQAPRLDPGSQLQVRYVASSNSYEVQVPTSQTWVAVSPVPASPGAPRSFAGGDAALYLRSSLYQYSRLLEWGTSDSTFGYEAIGMQTPTSGIPTTGSASYAGQILGTTSERHGSDDMGIQGAISLNFDFASGGLSGNISPILRQEFATFALGTIDFRDTVHAVGSTTFSGEFDTDLAGLNSFSGLFTGPHAEELIGNFALPYRSPIDGQTYQSDGAFVGAK